MVVQSCAITLETYASFLLALGRASISVSVIAPLLRSVTQSAREEITIGQQITSLFSRTLYSIVEMSYFFSLDRIGCFYVLNVKVEMMCYIYFDDFNKNYIKHKSKTCRSVFAAFMWAYGQIIQHLDKCNSEQFRAKLWNIAIEKIGKSAYQQNWLMKWHN